MKAKTTKPKTVKTVPCNECKYLKVCDKPGEDFTVEIGIPIEIVDIKKLKTIHGICDGKCKKCTDLNCKGRD